MNDTSTTRINDTATMPMPLGEERCLRAESEESKPLWYSSRFSIFLLLYRGAATTRTEVTKYPQHTQMAVTNPPSRDEVCTALGLKQFSLVDFTRIGVGEGFLGNLWIAHIKPSTHIVVKLCELPNADQCPEWLLRFLRRVAPHHREKAFYSLMTTAFPCGQDEARPYVPIPRSYANEGGEALLMEYLHEHHTPDFYAGLSEVQLEVAVRALARLHASTHIALKTQNQAAGTVTGTTVPESLENWHHDSDLIGASNIRTLCVDLAEALQGFLREDADTFLRSIGQISPSAWSSMSSHKPTCIVHGDCWSSNFMFSADEATAVLIDFQFARVGHPAEDLAVLLCTSVNPDLRRAEGSIHRLLTIYNDEAQRAHSELNISYGDFDSAMWAALELLVMSFDTWLGGAGKAGSSRYVDMLKVRFAATVEDVASLHTS